MASGQQAGSDSIYVEMKSAISERRAWALKRVKKIHIWKKVEGKNGPFIWFYVFSSRRDVAL